MVGLRPPQPCLCGRWCITGSHLFIGSLETAKGQPLPTWALRTYYAFYAAHFAGTETSGKEVTAQRTGTIQVTSIGKFLATDTEYFCPDS